MPKLEAIVVTPPQETIVQDYTKKEVCKIVNDGIQSGDVVLPAAEGGTKLYKHTIEIKRTGYSPININVIADKNTSAVLESVYGQKRILIKNSNIFPSIEFNPNYIRYIGKESGVNYSVIQADYNISSGTLTLLDLSNAESITDTITEL